MKSWVATLLVGAIFVSGVAVGALGLHLVRARRHFRPPRGGEVMTELMRERLDLTAEQEERIDVIVRDSFERSRALLGPVREKLEEVMGESERRFDEVLTPAQRAELERVRRERRSRGFFPPGRQRDRGPWRGGLHPSGPWSGSRRGFDLPGEEPPPPEPAVPAAP